MSKTQERFRRLGGDRMHFHNWPHEYLRAQMTNGLRVEMVVAVLHCSLTGRKHGSFVEAVVDGDLDMALSQADDQNAIVLHLVLQAARAWSGDEFQPYTVLAEDAMVGREFTEAAIEAALEATNV